VLLVLGEEDRDEVRRRLYRAVRAVDAIPPAGAIDVAPLAGIDCGLLARGETGDPVETAYLAALRDHVVRERYSLVALDPLARFGGAEAETNNAWGTRFIGALESLASPSGATVLAAHHSPQWARRPGATNRDDAIVARGVTALGDGARWVAVLDVERLVFDAAEERERLGEIVSLSLAKSNYSRRVEPLVCRRDREHGGALVPIDDADRELVRAARAGSGKAAQREAATEDATRRRDAADDEAAHRLVAEHPGTSVRTLTALLRKQLACGGTRAHAAVVRVRRGAP
jgi:RecA-family ATPase